MEVYLVQHAQAIAKQEDARRPLTEQGRRSAAAVAAACGRLGFTVHQIRHSGKTRAQQTAAILAETLSPPGGVVQASGLGPRDNVEPVAHGLEASENPVLLVGHLPFMERLAAYLLTGDPGRTVVEFTNAGIVCLSREGGRWKVRWILTPQMASL
jgi:phosphohistidine phosphatase